MENKALVGYTGFVGSTLLKQASFDALYRSTNIAEIDGREFGVVVCAGAPAKKWLANRNPEADIACINDLIGHLRRVRAEKFVLISTVDVFKQPAGADERSPVEKEGLHPYGLHRRLLEEFVLEFFPQSLIVRLPGLVGPGLRKNVIYDLHNNNNLDMVDSRSIQQFYPTVNLWQDISVALRSGLKLVHFTAEPVSVGEIAREAFGREFHNEIPSPPARYDMQTIHAVLFGEARRYQYGKRMEMLALRAYAQSEERRNPT
jgi:nucleoside-diphosphate-sugar epimerase